MYHPVFANDAWKKLSLIEQLANIGSEVSRMINWKNKNEQYAKLAFYRALELIDLTVADPKNIQSLTEILRVREVLADYFLGENMFKSTAQSLEKYFFSFGIYARTLTEHNNLN